MGIRSNLRIETPTEPPVGVRSKGKRWVRGGEFLAAIRRLCFEPTVGGSATRIRSVANFCCYPRAFG